uniref:Ovule protein n=1 Tax=Brugia timori TaxID=42155 RepID=A0A0R3Q551_9BILA
LGLPFLNFTLKYNFIYNSTCRNLCLPIVYYARNIGEFSYIFSYSFAIFLIKFSCSLYP